MDMSRRWVNSRRGRRQDTWRHNVDVQAKALIETLATIGGDLCSWRNTGRCGGRSSSRDVDGTLTKAKDTKPLNTLCNVEAEAQVETVVDTLTEAETEALGN